MKHKSPAPRLFCALTLAAALGLVPLSAAASEVKFGEGPASLQVDDAGQLTDAGKKSAVKELDKTPGEDAWALRVWAKLDKGAPGPLYIEFWQTVDVMGQKQEAIVYRHEENDYEGQKYVAYDVELEGKRGFNKNRAYEVRFLQVGAKGNDIRLATATLKLIDTGRKPPEGAGGKDPKKEEEEEEEDQDAMDSLAGPDEPAPPQAEGSGEGPPPTEANKKGCQVGAADLGVNGLLLLVLAGGCARGRRRGG